MTVPFLPLRGREFDCKSDTEEKDKCVGTELQ